MECTRIGTITIHSRNHDIIVCITDVGFIESYKAYLESAKPMSVVGNMYIFMRDNQQTDIYIFGNYLTIITTDLGALEQLYNIQYHRVLPFGQYTRDIYRYISSVIGYYVLKGDVKNMIGTYRSMLKCLAESIYTHTA